MIRGASNDWTEDFSHENGVYYNHCTLCSYLFVGHKRRVVCRKCAMANYLLLEVLHGYRKDPVLASSSLAQLALNMAIRAVEDHLQRAAPISLPEEATTSMIIAALQASLKFRDERNLDDVQPDSPGEIPAEMTRVVWRAMVQEYNKLNKKTPNYQELLEYCHSAEAYMVATSALDHGVEISSEDYMGICNRYFVNRSVISAEIKKEK